MRVQEEGKGGGRRGEGTERWSAVHRVRTDRQMPSTHR